MVHELSYTFILAEDKEDSSFRVVFSMGHGIRNVLALNRLMSDGHGKQKSRDKKNGVEQDSNNGQISSEIDQVKPSRWKPQVINCKIAIQNFSLSNYGWTGPFYNTDMPKTLIQPWSTVYYYIVPMYR